MNKNTAEETFPNAQTQGDAPRGVEREVLDERARRTMRDMNLEEIDREKIDKIILQGGFQNGGKIRMERRGPLDQEYYYLCTISADQWGNTEDRLERTKKMFGGGEYLCRAFRKDGKTMGSFEFKIDPRFKGQLDEQQIREKSGLTERNVDDLISRLTPAAPQGIAAGELLAIMDKASSKSEGTMTMMMTMMMKSMEIAAQQNAAMFTAMAGIFGGKQTQNSEAVLIELIKNSTQRTPVAETIQMMKELNNLSRDDDDFPPEKEESDLMKILKYAGPVLAGLMQGGAGGRTPPGATVSAPLPPLPNLPNAAAMQTDGLAAILPLLMGKLIHAAERNSDAGLYADLILDQLSDDQVATLCGLLTPADWCAKIGLDERMVAHVRPWLEELRRLILENGSTADIHGGAPGGPNSGGPNAPRPAAIRPDANPGVDGSGGPAKPV